MRSHRRHVLFFYIGMVLYKTWFISILVVSKVQEELQNIESLITESALIMVD